MSSIIKVDTIQNQSGANIISESANTITVGASGDTITVPSGATLGGAGTVDLSSATVTLNSTMKMTPSFFVYLTSNQDIPDNTATKVSGFTELLDTDNCFASNKFTPTTAGKYVIYAGVDMGSVGGTTSNLREAYTIIYKNGSFYAFSDNNYNGSFHYNLTIFTQTFVDFNGTTDYVELYAQADLTTGNPRVYGGGNKQTFFGGYKIIGA